MPCGITQSETMKSNLFRPKSTQRVSSLPCIRSVMYLIQLEPEAAGSLLSPSLRLSLSGAFLQMINPPDGAKQWKEGTGGWSRYWPNHFWGLSSQALAVGIQYCKQISGVCVGHWLGRGVRSSPAFVGSGVTWKCGGPPSGGLPKIAVNSSFSRPLFSDSPCLFINELPHWFVTVASAHAGGEQFLQESL